MVNPAGWRILRFVQGVKGKLAISNYFDYDLPQNYRARSAQELQSLILVKTIPEAINLPSGAGKTASRTHRFFYIIDPKTSQVIARKHIAFDPPESITRDNAGKVMENYTPEVKTKNNRQAQQEKDFFRSLY